MPFGKKPGHDGEIIDFYAVYNDLLMLAAESAGLAACWDRSSSVVEGKAEFADSIKAMLESWQAEKSARFMLAQVKNRPSRLLRYIGIWIGGVYG